MTQKIKKVLTNLKSNLIGGKKSAKGDFFWYIMPMAASFIFGLITLPIITKNISVSAYGQYDYLIIVVGFFGMFLSFGLSSAFQEALYRGDIGGFGHETIAKSIYLFWFYISGIGLAIGCAAYFFISGYPVVYLFFIYFSVFSSLMQNVPKEYLRKDRRPKLLAGVEVVSNLVKTLGIVSLLFISLVSLEMILLVGGVFAILRLFIFWYFYQDYNQGSFSFRALVESFKIGIPALPASISNYIIKASDRFFIKGIKGDEPLGLYAMNMKFDTYSTMFMMVIHNTFYPIFGNTLSDEKSNLKVENTIFRIIILFSFLLFVGAIFMKEFILIISRPEFYVGTGLFLIIANYIFFYLWQHLYQAHIVTSGKIKLIGFLRGSGALINLALNYYLVQWFSYTGAAISTLAAHAATVWLIYMVLRKDFTIEWQKHLLILIIMNSLILINMFMITLPDSVIHWDRIGIKIFLSIIIGVTVLMYTKPVTWSQIKNLSK